MKDVVYEPPTLVQIGEFEEVTLGLPTNKKHDWVWWGYLIP
ncbi:lasso RiPP family leader peptide-containing protein [Amycolatopsis sp. NPDC059021]